MTKAMSCINALLDETASVPTFYWFDASVTREALMRTVQHFQNCKTIDVLSKSDATVILSRALVIDVVVLTEAVLSGNVAEYLEKNHYSFQNHSGNLKYIQDIHPV